MNDDEISTKIAAMPMVTLPTTADGAATLMQDWTIRIRGWWFDVPTGTQTDGASIPRFLWRICGHPLQSPRVFAALMHDWLYGNGFGVPSDMTRAEADACYRDLLIVLGWGRVKSYIEYYALRMCGASHWTEREAKS